MCSGSVRTREVQGMVLAYCATPLLYVSRLRRQALLFVSALAAAAVITLRRRTSLQHAIRPKGQRPNQRSRQQGQCSKQQGKAAASNEALVRHLATFMGDGHALRLVAACQLPPSLTTLRVNTRLMSRADAIESLRTVLEQRGDNPAGIYGHPTVDDMICMPTSGPHELPMLPEVVIVDRRPASSHEATPPHQTQLPHLRPSHPISTHPSHPSSTYVVSIHFTHPIRSHPTPSCPLPPNPSPPYLIRSDPIQSPFKSSHPIPSYPIPSHPIPPHPIQSNPIQP